ncbi:mandelate racemase / muconate lactonizing enzyme, C-terminal domain protein [Rhodococcus sp. MTM3W5.2]|uniref:enolase C-terminal domain-like protein n=1 Tax=Rhodococcus sp. MTM3W5.2 TaxID=1805827 RepID=UPI00097928DD|nr:enolase C-terminal domain-like protein [Rhodococcus sp. MTM3W5.2]AQA20969.1 mandelate racemase / muconate lactonizing enzyme, C-terminal domain protein [Rhodococcus sp. MTM3W5.2]
MRLTWRATTLELARPFRISRSVMTGRTAVEIALGGADAELVGRGEVVSSAHAELGPERIVAELRRVRASWEGLSLDRVRVPGGAHPAVASALRTAVSEYEARGSGRTLAAQLGLPLLSEIPIARTIGIDSPPEMTHQAAALAASGFGLLKVKSDADVGASVRRLAAVAEAAPGAELIVDPNEAWTAGTALRILEEVRGLPIVAMEQPLAVADRGGQRELRSRTDVPVIADESISTVADLDGLDGLADAVNIKLTKCGGVHQARVLAEEARRRGLDVMLGCLVSSSLGIAPAVHLAALARWCDLDGHLLLARDPWHGLGGEDGRLRPTGEPGLGVRRSEEARS